MTPARALKLQTVWRFNGRNFEPVMYEVPRPCGYPVKL